VFRPTLDFDSWVQGVPSELTGDHLWTSQSYRLALFLGDQSWTDATVLLSDRRSRALVDQLLRAVGSITANIAEGYSRSTRPDRARFYEYALGSARESREWYYKVRHVLGESATRDRMELLTRVIRLLIVTVIRERRRRASLAVRPRQLGAS
jgi:four helix bundle protein